jgi:putative heme d1 biosynthesis radical SAM protein NirJ2
MIVSWNTTSRCTLQCPHCYRDAGASMAGELDTAEARRLIREIGRAGFRMLIFSGGEPMLREDLYELVECAAQGGLRPVLGTYGGSIDREAARRLKEAGLLAAGVSLDSVHPGRHDAFRGTPGLFDRVQGAFRALREAGIPFQVHMTVMDWNLGDLERMIDLAVGAGARACHFFFTVPAGRAAREAQASVSPAGYWDALRRVMRRSAEVPIEIKPVCAPQFIPVAAELGVPTRFRTGCLAGTEYCIVNPAGDVQPCAYLAVRAGNVREQPFSEIWANSPLFARLRTLDWRGACGSCRYAESCRGCRARAYAATGDFMAGDPFCGGRVS